ncbi:MAG: hypothetical protein PVJ57_12040 [Phycisphaerae bacterium]|jgi:hypothetical protein
MALGLFSDMIDALGNVVGKLKSIATFPKAQREAIRQPLDETCRLIDTTLNMVIIRLGDILLESQDEVLLKEAARLDNFEAWMNAEREFRLCRSLRVAEREMTTLAGKVGGAISTKDWEALLEHVRTVLAAEDHVAVFICRQFERLAGDAGDANPGTQAAREVRDTLTAFRAALVSERQALIQHERALYDVI